MIVKFLGILLAVLANSSITNTFELETIIINTRLPVHQRANKLGYDGDDSIYLWAGETGSSTRDINIYKFSISAQTIESVGTTPDSVIYGSGCYIGNDCFVQFGGMSKDFRNYSSEIWNFGKTNPGDWKVVSNLPNGMSYTSSVWDYGENIYIIGGSLKGSIFLNTIYKYSSTSQSVEIVGELPTGITSAAAIWDNNTRTVYIFGGLTMAGGRRDEIFEFNPVDGSVVKLDTRLPKPNMEGCALSIGNEAYIIGGANYPNNSAPPMLRFNPSTNDIVSVPVHNLPPSLSEAGCAYVEKENRIYIFGGTDHHYRNQIMYIDLHHTPTTTPTSSSTMTPTTTPTKRREAPSLSFGWEI